MTLFMSPSDQDEVYALISCLGVVLAASGLMIWSGIRSLRSSGSVAKPLVLAFAIVIVATGVVHLVWGGSRTALSSNAKSNAMAVQQTIESCGAQTSDGTLVEKASAGRQAVTCATRAQIVAAEPSLAKLFAKGSCGGTSPCVTVLGGDDPATDYVVRSISNSTSPRHRVVFVITRNEDGVEKTCYRAKSLSVSGGPKDEERCPTGRW
jgi:hypothetical protein